MKTKNNIIVTGGAGFIGTHLVDLLVQKNFNVFSVDNYHAFWGNKPSERLNKKAHYLKCDIRSYEKLNKIFAKIKPLFVFHVAALARIQPSIADPQKYLEVNSLGTLNVLRAAKNCRASRVIYSASSSAYGLNPIPSKENMCPNPLNPYAKTKLDGEQWMKIFAEIYGIETVSLRYFNVYGPKNTFVGSYTTVITKFLHQRKNKKPMTIVGDGNQTRDYTHVRDVVRANYLAAISKKVGRGEVINIGCGRRYSVNFIARTIGGRTVHVSSRPGESRNTLADWSLAKKLLGWRPTVKLEDGICELKKITI